MLQPVLWGGEERAVYIVICPQGSSGCFAGTSHGNPEITG
jgi:hypothetical protein